jgi:hypothetical protein
MVFMGYTHVERESYASVEEGRRRRLPLQRSSDRYRIQFSRPGANYMHLNHLGSSVLCGFRPCSFRLWRVIAPLAQMSRQEQVIGFPTRDMAKHGPGKQCKQR